MAEARIPGWIDRSLPPGIGTGDLVLVAWSVSCASLALLLATYVMLTPGFAASLAGGGPAAGYLLRQVLANGLPVVFLVNFAGFWLYARRARSRPVPALASDAVLRALLVVGLHAAIFAASARVFGSFGGDPAQALGAVGPTLADAWRLGNLSGVYLYATAPSAFPLYAAVALAAAPSRAGGTTALAVAFLPAFVAYAGVLSLIAGML